MSRILVRYEFYGTLRTILAEDEAEGKALINSLTNKARRACAWFEAGEWDKDKKRFSWNLLGKNKYLTEDMYDLFGLPYDNVPDVNEPAPAEVITENGIQVVYMTKHGEKKVECFSVRDKADVMYSVCAKSGTPVYMTVNGKLVLKANCK